MKLTAILLFLSLFSVGSNTYSQGTSISIKLENKSIIDAFNEIEKVSDYGFFFKNDQLDLEKQYTLEFTDANIQEVMGKLLDKRVFDYQVIGRTIVVNKTTENIFVSQERTVRGVVTDAGGISLPGVTVVVKGTTTGTVTNSEGSYTLSNVPSTSTLVFSFVGMKTLEVPVEGQAVISVVMEEETVGLEEVVAIGYGSMQKKHLTGAIGSINMGDELVSRPVTDIGQAIYGRVAGVQIINASGRPGESSSIQIRGMNSLSAGSTPLLVIDGIPMPDFDLNAINTTDIESIDILKDAASAAIYGSRGSNGVILVTTKEGTPGEPRLNFNYTYSSQSLIRKAPMMNAAEYAQASMDLAQNGWIDSGGDPNAPNTIEARGQYKYTWHPALENPSTLPDTDWQDLAFGVTPMHKADLSFSGGNEKSRYYLSGGVVDQEGILNYYETRFTRYNMSIKADSKINDWLSIGGMLSNSYSKEKEAPRYMMTYVMQYPPIFPEKSEDGYWGGTGTVPGWENYIDIYFRERGHPFSRPNEDRLHKRFNTLGNLYAEISILPELKYRTAINTAIRRHDNTEYYPVDRNLGPGTLESGTFISNMARTMNYTYENLLTYTNTWEDHSFDAMVGYEVNQLDYYFTTAQRRNFDDDVIRYLSAGSLVYDANDNAYSSALLSALARINYNYKGRYMASVAFRRDGSSRFGPDKKWGNFPSFSAGWRISDEIFMSSLNSISNLKLKASYGFTGNNSFADYAWVSQMDRQNVAFGNHLTTSLYPSSVANPELGWERTRLLNVGFELGLYDNRIVLEADLYHSKSDDLLLNVPVPSTSGFPSVLKNTGEVQNRGIELNLSTHNMTGELSWTTQITYSANRNEITKLGVDDAPMLFSPGESMQSINMVGEPLFSFYGYIYEGSFLNQAEIDAAPDYPYDVKPGMGKYRDVSGDGKIDGEDRTIIGNNQPDFALSINNNFKYKNFDLSFMWQGLFGNDVYDAQFRRSMIGNQGGRNYLNMKNDRWRSESDPGDGYHFKLTNAVKGNDVAPSTYWISDGTYFRLKDITLGYTLPKAISSKAGLANARVFFNGINLITIQDSHLIDPENFGTGNGTTITTDAYRRGVSHNPYPSAKVFSFGVNVEF